MKGVVSEETVVLHRWGSSIQNVCMLFFWEERKTGPERVAEIKPGHYTVIFFL